jgi:hypothetical protein
MPKATPWLKDCLLEAYYAQDCSLQNGRIASDMPTLNYAKHKFTIMLHVISINLLSLVQHVSLKMLRTFWMSTHSIIGQIVKFSRMCLLTHKKGKLANCKWINPL